MIYLIFIIKWYSFWALIYTSGLAVQTEYWLGVTALLPKPSVAWPKGKVPMYCYVFNYYLSTHWDNMLHCTQRKILNSPLLSCRAVTQEIAQKCIREVNYNHHSKERLWMISEQRYREKTINSLAGQQRWEGGRRELPERCYFSILVFFLWEQDSHLILHFLPSHSPPAPCLLDTL